MIAIRLARRRSDYNSTFTINQFLGLLINFLLAIATQSIVASSFIITVPVLQPVLSQLQECRRRHRQLSSHLNNMNLYPDLVVYDLDACFWDKEMYEMPSVPSENDIVIGDLNGRGQGVVGVMSGRRHQISLHKGALQSLQEHADGTLYPGMKVAFASSADTVFAETIGRAALKLLEVLPGLTVWDLVVGRDWKGVDVNQIGRQPPLLSSNKAKSHFPRLREVTGIRYDRMLFFDDCNWGDHCGMVAEGCKEGDTGIGPATVRTPYGLGVKEWKLGLEVYAKHAKKLMEKTTSNG
ncbi:Bicoid-interacting protein 3 (Bin3) [Fragilaria crotonensis]|nr:Bicoid-interacting protein 3 (Bin3) [Fragilaria crotonensis]